MSHIETRLDDICAKLEAMQHQMDEAWARIRAMHRTMAGRYVSRDEVISYGNDDYPATVMASTAELAQAVRNPTGYTPPTLPG